MIEQDLCRVFAFALGSPTPGRYEWLCNTGAGFRRYADYEAAYIAVFDVGAPEPPVPLLESAHNKAVPPQQIALENMDFFSVVGLKADTSLYPPDHLVTQLEFLSAVRYLRDNSPANRDLTLLERDFVERHLLNWLPAAVRKLRKQSPPVFPGLLSKLVAYLRQEYAR